MTHLLPTRFRHAALFVLAPLLACVTACNVRYSTAAFHLPRDGDAERGKAAFVELGCNSCHQVVGVSLPKSDLGADSVVLGGQVDRKMTDAYLVTHVLEPSYRGPATARPRMTNAGQVRMPGFGNQMTVRQLTDIVAFLQSHYRLSPMPTGTWYQ